MLKAKLIYLAILSLAASAVCISAQTGNVAFRVGERLSYSVSFERFPNVAYLETAVVSRGTIGGREVIELQGRLKTLDFVSATFSLIDESRTVLVDPSTGLPVVMTRTIRSGAVPREMSSNFLANPTTNFDLLSLLYKVREAGGVGSFPFVENGENFVANFQLAPVEKGGSRVRTDAGEFEVISSTVQSPYFDALGFRSFKIDFTADENKVPVRLRVETARGLFTVALASARVDDPAAGAPDPLPTVSPRPAATPRPLPTPTPYIDNQGLLRELKFSLGETLDYRVTLNTQAVASMRLQVKERRQFQGVDSLLLSASFPQIFPGSRLLSSGDTIIARVNPDTLTPQAAELRFSPLLSVFNHSFAVNAATGAITAPSGQVEAPIGTHSVLSLLYAMRSFNLQPSRTTNNPVNDTRVAVFWRDRTYIFVLKPSAPDTITMDGKKIPAQMVAVTTGDPQLDALQPRVWLSLDESRVPLRMVFGEYQIDLTAISFVTP